MAYINSNSKIFYELIKQNGFELVVPDYQREFEWDDENFLFLLSELKETDLAIDAWNFSYKNKDVFNFDQKASNFKNQQLFLGNIVMQKNNIVDGQQRLTSIMIIMKALSDIYEKMENRPSSKNQFISEISNKYRQKKGNKFFPLIDSRVITSSKKTTASQVNSYFIDNKLGKNFKIFKLYNKAVKFFKEIKNIKDIIDLISFRILTIQFIVMEIDHLEIAFDIFEKLNSTSTPLSPSDLIKNKLIAKFHNEKNFIDNKNIKDILKEIMNNLTNEKGNTLDPTTFYRTALMIRNAYDKKIDENKTYIVKNKLYNSQFENQTNEKLRDKILFIYNLSRTYNKHFVKNDVNGLYKNIAYRFLDMKKTIVLSTLTLYFCKLKEEKIINDFDWYKLIKWTENYFIGMFTISNNPSKEVDKIIPPLIHRINNAKEKLTYKNILNTIQATLVDQFPKTDRDNVYKNLKSITLKNAQAIQILNKLYDEINFSAEKLEKFNKDSNSLNYNAVNNEYTSLEHFLPQNVSKWSLQEDWEKMINSSNTSYPKPNSNDPIYKYIYSIGNMFILHQKNNSGLGNETFLNKKEKLMNDDEKSEYFYSQNIFNSLLIIKRDLNALDSWTKNDIEKRAKLISEIMEKFSLLSID